MKLAYLIRNNKNPQAVVLTRELIVPTMASLKLKLYQEIKNSPDINDDFDTYEKTHRWDYVTLPLIQFDSVAEGPRSHVAENFPKPASPTLPAQSQLPRKQLPLTPPAAPIPAATTLSDRSDPAPGVPEPLRRLHEAQLEIDKNEEGFTCRNPMANDSIVGKGETQEQAITNYFQLVNFIKTE